MEMPLSQGIAARLPAGRSSGDPGTHHFDFDAAVGLQAVNCFLVNAWVMIILDS
jgi:hypothetical protein